MLYTIGDIHLSFSCQKPMDIFGTDWSFHTQRLFELWNKFVKPSDTVVLAGDSSWAINFSELLEDFKFIDSLPGKKIILKGNHDYWWETITKLKKFTSENNFNTIDFLYNNAFLADEKFVVCGTRSWLFDEGEKDQKILSRELIRLKLSLEYGRKIISENRGKNLEQLVFLHYPPIFDKIIMSEVINLLKSFNIKKVFYGHIHGQSQKYALDGIYDGIEYRLISADYLKFDPLPIY